ncbi:unnamed protein product [Spirodela intermedia]|uniref:Uncharacterized protein n=1 Tax=Spirodela intermedia TaxID=51605 RepID=A0ABN7E910_SPIIN|nr:unnamed protein product [Spirodela intermedia]
MKKRSISCIEDLKVEIEHVGTKDQRADILTKSFGRVKFTELHVISAVD